MLPLYEAKMIHYFDHRLGTYEGQTQAQANMGTLPRLSHDQQDDPDFVVLPRYWVQEFDTLNEQKSKPDKPVYNRGVTSTPEAKHWDHGWLLGWRDICRSTDERTVICAHCPAPQSDTLIPLCSRQQADGVPIRQYASFVFDYVARQKMAGTHLTYSFLNQLPVLPPDVYEIRAPWQEQARPLKDWIETRVLELSLHCLGHGAVRRVLGDDGPPFRWDEERRTLIRAELDAAYFHLYGLERDEVEHVMDSSTRCGAARRSRRTSASSAPSG